GGRIRAYSRFSRLACSAHPHPRSWAGYFAADPKTAEWHARALRERQIQARSMRVQRRLLVPATRAAINGD
ncbi:MAG: hypothetical protein ACI8PT_001631, partial [Gammaproteobacteria bacterium]